MKENFGRISKLITPNVESSLGREIAQMIRRELNRELRELCF